MSQLSTPKTIYYLPGRGGRIGSGLGGALIQRGYNVCGRETAGEFQKLGFTKQVQAIRNDLLSEFWNDDALVIANSYGAYLLLHAQSELPPFPGRLMLLSPILGGSSAPQGSVSFLPPFSDLLMKLAREGQFTPPACCEIHVGEDDWQCQPDRVIEFGDLLGILVTVVPDSGHVLQKSYVSSALNAWLPSLTA